MGTRQESGHVVGSGMASPRASEVAQPLRWQQAGERCPAAAVMATSATSCAGQLPRVLHREQPERTLRSCGEQTL